MGWKTKLILLGLVGYAGFSVYKFHQAGYFDMPALDDGDYWFSFNDGLRGILVDPEVSDSRYATAPVILRQLSRVNPDRRYFSISSDVAPWFEDVWSKCVKPTEAEKKFLEEPMTPEIKRDLVGARLDGVCFIKLDGTEGILRGLLYSVPRL